MEGVDGDIDGARSLCYLCGRRSLTHIFTLLLIYLHPGFLKGVIERQDKGCPCW